MSEHTLGKSHFVTLRDGRKLHYRQRGTGSPTVVFEAGMGLSSATWGMVQPEVAKHTLAIAYDRAGIGKSDWDDHERTVDRIADDLQELLESLQGPFILVGHSWGGPILRRLAARRAVDIRGLILLDPTDEHDDDYFKEVRNEPNPIVKAAVLWLIHTVGLRLAFRRVLKDMPTDCRREIMWRDISRNGIKVWDAELEPFIPGLTTLREEPDPLTGIDVTLVSGAGPKQMKADFRPALVEAHRKTVEMLDLGNLVVATKSGHYTPMTEPGLVADDTVKMVEKHRN